HFPRHSACQASALPLVISSPRAFPIYPRLRGAKGDCVVSGRFAAEPGSDLIAVNVRPALERLVVSGFPVGQFGHNRNAGHNLNVKAEIRSVLKHNSNGAALITGRDFHPVNNLASDLGVWRGRAPLVGSAAFAAFDSTRGTCNFISSHVACLL